MVVQSNLNGAVIGPDASTDANIAVFDGITGKRIKDSNVTLASLQDAITKAHEHTNKTQLDSFTKTETELLGEVDTKIATATADFVTSEELTGSLGDYVTTETYNTKIGQIDSEIGTINTTLNNKVDNTKLGDLGDSGTVVDYVNTKVAEAAGLDEEAVQNLIDTSLSITEF